MTASLSFTSARAAGNTPDAQDLAVLPKAFAAQDAKDWVGARTLTEKSAPIVRELVQWRYVSMSGSGATFDEINSFLTAHTSWPGRGAILQRGEEALLAENLVESRGTMWFKGHPARTSSGCLAFAKFQFAHEQKSEALAGIRRCWLALTLNLTDYQDWSGTSGLSLSEADHLVRADTLLWNRNVSGARELVPLLTAKAKDATSARVQIQSGTTVDLDEALESAPTASWAASLIYDQSVQFRKATKVKEAWALLMKADDTGALPSQNSQTWWPEHNLDSRTALDAQEYDAAYKLASRTHLSSEISIAAYLDAEFLSGWIALRKLDQPKMALVHFQNLEAAAKSPVSRARAAYWRASAFRALDEEGKAQQATSVAAAEPNTFYGRLALESQKEPRPGASTAPKPSTSSSSEDIEELVQASETLHLAGDVRRANYFANAAIDGCQSTGCATTLSARFTKKGNTYGALRSAKKAQTLGVSRADQLFPLIDLPASCTAAGVPASLILALVRQESEFDPSATSNANAHGLMQILPSTAKDVARRYKIPFGGASDLLQPQTNLAIGCYHVKDLLDGLAGSYVLTIAAYNAGKSRVLGWTTTHGDPRDPNADVVDWIEAIPFDETRNYVMRVLENGLAYKSRLGEPLQTQELNLDLRRKS
ncbi:MAG: lytic transglycosylase domain-containing protein [Micropepsaceae bacterium]